jgi:AcrR family transcriptional regulator
MGAFFPPGAPAAVLSAVVRERILEATYACVVRDGLGSVTMDRVAHEAGVSRATLYRQFPGGRDELVRAVVDWEVGRFFARLADAVAGAPDFETLLERGLVFAHRAVRDHDALQRALHDDRAWLSVELARIEPMILGVIRGYFVSQLTGVVDDLEDAADYVARMVLSFMATPGGWDLDDPDAVRRLVRTQFLGGL